MNEKMVKAFNEQINKEFYSEFLYLAMKGYFAELNLQTIEPNVNRVVFFIFSHSEIHFLLSFLSYLRKRKEGGKKSGKKKQKN